jgi:hypothetical protein
VLYDVLADWYQVGLLAKLKQNMLCLLLRGRVLHVQKDKNSQITPWYPIAVAVPNRLLLNMWNKPERQCRPAPKPLVSPPFCR